LLLLDHVTLATRDLEGYTEMLERELGIRFEPPTETFPGARGRVARLGQGFLEMMTVEDEERIRSTPLGQAFWSYWNRKEGIFAVALEVRRGMHSFLTQAATRGISFMGPVEQKVPVGSGRFLRFQSAFLGWEMPWLIEYDMPREWSGKWMLDCVEIGVSSLEEEGNRYIQAYNPREVSRVTERTVRMMLDRGSLQLTESPVIGFQAVYVSGEGRRIRIFADEAGWHTETVQSWI
jgi:hypothetical protein